jgi:hypothetical protein
MNGEPIKQRLEKRTRFLQACSRGAIDLASILKRRDWRETILDYLNEVDAEHRWEEGGPHVPPEIGRQGDGCACESERLRDSAKLLREHFINRFVFHPEADLGNDAWKRWAQWETLIYGDATLLEILAATPLPGEPGIHAFKETCFHTRRYYRAFAEGKRNAAQGDPTVPDAEEFLYKNPSWRSIELRLMAVPSQDRPAMLFALLESFAADGEAIAWATEVWKKVGPWLRALRRVLSEVGGASRFAQALGLELFLDVLDSDRMNRVAAILAATSNALGADHERRDPEGYPEDTSEAEAWLTLEQADDLEEAHRAFMKAGVRALNLAEGSEECWKAREVLERAWWASFENYGSFATFAFRLAAAVFGLDYAYAKASSSALKSKDRIEIVNVPKRERHPADHPPKVVVFGAGIAGLTAAHELAERGFHVVVVEKTAPTMQGEESIVGSNEEERKALGLLTSTSAPVRVQVGGLARTQWDRLGSRKRFHRHAKDSASPRTKRLGGDEESTPLPGEHGYRFFPSFYRHLFDTMKRTPLPGTDVTTGRYATAFDQLQPTYREIFAMRARDVPLSRGRPRTLEAFRRETTALTEGLGFERRDLARFFFKLLGYLMTCSARRAQYEERTLLEFVGADAPGYYSQAFLDALKAAPKALVAMDAERADARTQLNIYLQLLIDQVLGSPYTDGTLRGPTSVAWLEPWRRHLERLDVTFHNAELLSLGESSDGLRFVIERGPDVPGTLEWSAKEVLGGAAYVVVALDAVGAERVTSDWNFNGVPREIRHFTTYVERAIAPNLTLYVIAVGFPCTMSRSAATDELCALLTRTWAARADRGAGAGSPLVFRSIRDVTGELTYLKDGADEVSGLRIGLWFDSQVPPEALDTLRTAFQSWAPPRSEVRLVSYAHRAHGPVSLHTPRIPERQYGATPGDRFQTFSGIQYYLSEDFKLVRGYVYFPDSEWGLSAVSQSQFWWLTEGRFLPRSVRGVFSVDVGNTQRKSAFTRKSFVESDPGEIEREIWRQVGDGLRSTRGPTSIVTNLPVPARIDFHLDQNLQFARDGLRANLVPFLVNNAGDWKNRPRCMPWVPGQSKFALETPRTDRFGVWQAPHGGYRVHAGHVVFCGTYMRTFTRMTTMEAANESARHAVNAILSHMAYATHEHGRVRISGDYCDIWDPEDHELDDLAFFKRVDEMLFRAGKPTIAEILRFDRMADLEFPLASDGQALLASLLGTSAKDWGIQPIEVAGALNGLFEVLRRAGETMGGPESPLLKLMTMLGFAKGGTAGPKEPR